MRRSVLWMQACVIALGCASCGLLSPQADPTRYAVLASVDELSGPASPAAEADSAQSIGLGPISFPDYLRNAAMVTREGGTRLVRSPTERWAEPFERSLERVLVLNLRREPAVSGVILYPWYATERPAVQVQIDFSRCERDANAGVVVAARWQVRWLDGSREPIDQETRVVRPSVSAEGDQVALAISEALAEICALIGAALR